MRQFTLTIILLIFIPFSDIIANDDICLNKDLFRGKQFIFNENRRLERAKRKHQLMQLKDGVLLVRLKTSENKISAYERKGNKAKADIIRIEQKIENQSIINAFKSYYNFSKVYFFYSDQTERVKSGDWNGIFLNRNLEPDSSIKPENSGKWFVAEFDFLEADTVKYWQGTYYNRHTKQMEKVYSGTSPDFYRRSLVVRDNDFFPLKRPFPYYVSCKSNRSSDPTEVVFNNLPKRSIPRAVRKLDYKLKRKFKKFYGITLEKVNFRYPLVQE